MVPYSGSVLTEHLLNKLYDVNSKQSLEYVVKPIKGMSIYDSFIPTMVQNITFMDYPAKNPAGARRHALGAHFNHKFGLIPKAFALRDIKYVNVDNYFQNSYTESTDENGDDYTIWTIYGDTMGTTAANKIRSLYRYIKSALLRSQS